MTLGILKSYATVIFIRVTSANESAGRIKRYEFWRTSDQACGRKGLHGTLGQRSKSFFKPLVILEKAQPYEIKSICANGQLRKVVAHVQRSLLRELDESGILLHDELRGKAGDVLMAVRKKGQAAGTWAECYQSKSSVILDSGKRCTLKREITHAIHNAGKVAAYQLAKVWGSKTRN